MYCKLFASLYQGTLRGKSHEILVFTNLLATCDKEGFVDKHFRAISEEVGLTIQEVQQAILNLEAPDAESRSQELKGARIERIEEHRNWGWRIVNYVKYSKILNSEERREYNRIRQAEYRRIKCDSHKMSLTVGDKDALSQMCTHVDVHVNGDINEKEEETVASLPSPLGEEKMEKAVKDGERALKAQRTSSFKKSINQWENQPIAREWGREFEKFFSKPYVWVKGDDKGVSILNSSKVSTEEIVEVIRSTWNNRESYWFDKVHTIGFFANKFNDLRADSENYRKQSISKRGANLGPSGCFLED